VIKPTAATLRDDTRIDWAGTFSLPAPSSGVSDPLTAEIDLAWVYVEQVTGRDLDAYSGNLEPLVNYAIKLRVVQQSAQQKGQYSDIFNSISGIQSFSVPGYSETRATAQASRNGDQRDYRYNPWKPLDEVLHLIATPEARDQAIRSLTMSYEPSIAFEHTDEVIPLYGIERDMLD
jgi:hypothetical protein